MASGNTSKKEKEIFAELDALQDNSIREWLDEIKINGAKDNKVPNPLSKTGSTISTISKGGIYPAIIKWCIKNYSTYNFTNIPNYKEISSYISGSPAATASPAAATTKAKSPAIDFTLIAKKWKDNPNVDPFTGASVTISINPASEYVAIYSKILDGLTKHLLKMSSNKVLSVEDCKYIKESMPDEHAIYHTGTDIIHYDHLLFKNFLELKSTNARGVSNYVYAYDKDYLKEIQPYVYSHIYEVVNIKLKGYAKYNEVKALLEYYCHLSFDPVNPTFPFTIGYMIERMCKDIKNVLYMHESKITSEQINKAIFNKEVIKYFISIVKFHLNQGLITNQGLRTEIRSHFNNNEGKYKVDSKNEFHFIDYIYEQFVDHFFPRNPNNPTQYDLTKDVNVCDALLPVYDCILKLYSDNSIKNAKYKYVKDPYNINKVEEPQYPIKIQQLPRDLQLYKLRSISNAAAKDSAKERQIKQIEEENQRIFDEKVKKYEKDKEEYDKKKAEYDKKFNEEIEKYDKKKEEYDKKLKENLIVFKKKHEGFDKILEEKIKKYKKDKDIHDRIYKGKFSPKPNIGKWMGEALKMNKKHNSANDVKVPKALSANALAFGSNKYKRSSSAPKVSFVKYDSKLKTFSLNLAKDKHARRGIDKIEYINEEDPITQEPFDEMHKKKQKYSSDIVSYNKEGKAFHYRFETINLYNHILDCIRDCKKPINPANREELTDENFEEICHKIKFFAYKPTFNSHIQINALLNNCKYDNLLAFSYKVKNLPVFTTKPIIGRVNIFLVINLGGILFRVINKIDPDGSAPNNYPNQNDEDNSVVLVLPYLTDDILEGVGGVSGLEDTYHPASILTELQQKLPKGDMLGVKFFPYRKNNKDGERWKEIVKLPQFDLNFSDTKDVVFKKLTDYKNNKIAVL
jgi:hypothetical protein